MKGACEATRHWLVEAGIGTAEATEADRTHQAHLAACPVCRGLQQSYEALSVQCRQRLSHQPDAEAEASFMLAAKSLAGIEGEGRSRVAAAGPTERLAPSRLPGSPPVRASRSAGSALGQLFTHRNLIGGTVAAAAMLGIVYWAASDAARLELRAGKGVETRVAILDHSGTIRVDGLPLAAAARELAPGSTIVTGPTAHLQLGETSNALLRLGPDTRVQLQRWGQRHTSVALEAGTLSAVVHERAQSDPFVITTENARITVVGTEFSVTHTPAGATVVRGRSGVVRVERADGSHLALVSGGEILRIPPADAPSPASATARDTPSGSGPGSATRTPPESRGDAPPRPADCDCSLPNATSRCAAGACEITGCQPHWYDCDGVVANGCELDLRQGFDDRFSAGDYAGWTRWGDTTLSSTSGSLHADMVKPSGAARDCSHYRDLTLEARVRITDGYVNRQAGLVYRVTNLDPARAGNSFDGYQVALQERRDWVYLKRRYNGAEQVHLAKVRQPLQPGRWYQLKIVVSGCNHKVFLDGRLLIETDDCTWQGPGKVGLFGWDSISEWDWVRARGS